MVTTSASLTVEVKRITLTELGAAIGIPINIRPWWGSVRGETGEFHKGCPSYGWVAPERYTAHLRWCYACKKYIAREDVEVRRVHRRYLCPGGYAYSQIKRPEVRRAVVVIWQGPCRIRVGTFCRHNHRQSVEVLDVATEAKAMLIRISVSTTTSHFLIGMDDGHPFVTPVNRKSTTVQDAFDWLMPNKVREAYALGLDVKRQGDWFFIPTTREPKIRQYGLSLPGNYGSLKGGILYRGVPLVYGSQTRHTGGLVIYGTVPTLAYPVPFVKGNIKAPNHPVLHLTTWHIGVRTRSTTGGNRDGQPGMD